jgi:hypothetical protein
MRHENKEVRTRAFQALLYAYSEDELWSGDATTGSTLNPDVRKAFEEMSKDDPDAELREAARQVLENLHKDEGRRNQK